jgi:arylsulfatase A-like enzyme
MPGWRHLPFFSLLCLFALSSCGAPSARRPNLVIIVIDTVRADRLSCYGYRRPTTPRIDELCASGIRFQNASSTSSWTLPAHASLFTGLFPISHGATQEHVKLDAGAPTLAEILGAHGYATFAASANPLVGANTGLDRGFDAFAETWRRREGERQTEPDRHPNLLAVTRFLEALERDRPFFLFVNYIEAHGPYAPPEPHRSSFLKPGTKASLVRSALRRGAAGYYLDPSSISPAEFEVLNDLYDGEVARVDALVGALIDSLERSGRLDDAVVFVTSDHGENIGDHGHFRHVFSLYDSTVRIPLIALLPGGRRAGEVRSEPVTLVDLFATVLSQAGIEPPAGRSSGRDILGGLEDAAEAPVFAEYYYPLQALGIFPPGTSALHPAPLDLYLRRLRSVQLGSLRLIAASDGRDELFDLSSDPAERRNLAGDSRLAEQERRLRGLLEEFVKRAGGAPPLPAELLTPDASGGAFGDLDPEAVERLRELGYLRD